MTIISTIPDWGADEGICKHVAQRAALHASNTSGMTGVGMQFEKQHVQRDIGSYKSPYQDPFSYRSLKDVGIPAFSEVFKMVMAASLSRDDHDIANAEIELKSLMEAAGEAFDPNFWLLAELDGKTAALLLPQPYPLNPSKGSIFYIGVLNEFRGNGYAKIIHAKSLEILANRGVRKYVGSADVLNGPMISVFLSNGCIKSELRFHELPQSTYT